VLLFSTRALPPSGVQRYAISARQVVAVVESLPVVRVPGSLPHMRGIAVWRGDVVPVIDFRGEEARAGRVSDRYLIARCGPGHAGAPVAFGVDPAIVLHRPTRDDRENPGVAEAPPHVTGFFGVGGEPIGLVDLDALIDTRRSAPAVAIA
jgi:chemotaxis signal transduction protein